jgi:hypothetical protein
MKDRKSFMNGLLSGLAPPSVFERSNYPSLEGSDMSRMRNDVERVGKQLSTVIDRENGKKAQSARAQARSK